MQKIAFLQFLIEKSEFHQGVIYQAQLRFDYNQMDKKDETVKFKVLIIGPSGAGKTTLLHKYVNNKFSYDYQITTGIECYTKEVQINQKNSIKLQIWDTMGQQAYKSVVKSQYKGVAAVIFFYSIDKRQSFEKLAVWVREVKENVHEQTMLFLIGSKLDLEDARKVGKEEGDAYCKSINALFFQQISAKTGENVKEVFDKISKQLFKKYQSSKTFKQFVKPKIDLKSQSFRLKRDDGGRGIAEKKACC